jgi:hypothetical protein
MRTRPTASEARERRRRAVELRLAGATYQVIADQLNWSGPSGAHQEVARALRAGEGAAVELRDLEMARLDVLQTAVWPKAVAGHLKSVDAVLAIMARRSRLLGLDAPRVAPERIERVPLVGRGQSRRRGRP